MPRILIILAMTAMLGLSACCAASSSHPCPGTMQGCCKEGKMDCCDKHKDCCCKGDAMKGCPYKPTK